MNQLYEPIKSFIIDHIGTFISTTIGIILLLIFYFKSKRIRKPKFFVWSFNLIKDASKKLKKLEVIYSKKKIENLTVTKIAFWNDGKETIRKDDIPQAAPLKIVINNKYKILEAEVIKRTNEENLVKVIKKNNKSIIVTFDYLDKGEGATIQVIHTGQSSEDINFIGKIKGAGPPKRIFIMEEFMRSKQPIFGIEILKITAPKIISILILFSIAIGLFILAIKVISLALKIFLIIMAIISFLSGIPGIVSKGPPKELIEL